MTTSVQNCTDGAGQPVSPGSCAAFNASLPDENIPYTTRYDALGRAFETVDALGHIMHRDYDLLGRTTATIVNYADGSADGSADDLTTQVVYDAGGRQVETIDAGGTVTRFEYDLLDRLTCVIENAQPGVDCVAAVADPSLDSNVATRYEYDRAGNRTAIIDANGHQRRFSYDAADRLSSETDALGQTTVSSYDRLGRLTITDDPRGDAYDVTYSYDGLGRPTGMAATELDAPITLAYDALGRRTSLSDGTGTTTFTPDALGRITQVTAPDTGTVGYQYNPRGQRTQIRYPDGSTVLDYSYDALGQMEGVQQGSETLASYTYDAGRLQTIERANGADTTITYDDAGRIDDLTTFVDGTTMAVFDYTVNRVGQRVQVNETLAVAPPAPPRYDITGNSMGDILWRNPTTGDNELWSYDRDNESTSVQPLTHQPPTWQVAGVGDLDGNGQADILWRNPTTGDNELWLFSGSNVTTQATLSNGTAWQVMSVNDADGDGRADIFWRDPATGDNRLWLMNGATRTSDIALPSLPNTATYQWHLAGTGDVNADGTADIVWRNMQAGAEEGRNVIWLLDAAALDTPTGVDLLVVANLDWFIVGVGDTNGDGIADLLWRKESAAEETAIWFLPNDIFATTRRAP